MTLAEIITKVLTNPQLNVVLTEDGFDWMPTDFSGETPFLGIANQEGLYNMAGNADPLTVIDGLAEYITDNIREWICDAIDNEQDAHEPDDERIGFLGLLLEKF
jgi:hypothetical protein